MLFCLGINSVSDTDYKTVTQFCLFYTKPQNPCLRDDSVAEKGNVANTETVCNALRHSMRHFWIIVVNSNENIGAGWLAETEQGDTEGDSVLGGLVELGDGLGKDSGSGECHERFAKIGWCNRCFRNDGGVFGAGAVQSGDFLHVLVQCFFQILCWHTLKEINDNGVVGVGFADEHFLGVWYLSERRRIGHVCWKVDRQCASVQGCGFVAHVVWVPEIKPGGLSVKCARAVTHLITLPETASLGTRNRCDASRFHFPLQQVRFWRFWRFWRFSLSLFLLFFYSSCSSPHIGIACPIPKEYKPKPQWNHLKFTF